MLNLTARRAPQFARSLSHVASRSLATLKNHKYTVSATASGNGRNGPVKSNGFELQFAAPKELGGTGEGTNPEQLFAMGYATCLLGAIQLMAGRLGKKEMGKQAVVHTTVHIGETENKPGLGLAIDIKVEGIDEELLKAGHEICPYSRLTRDGAVVNVSLA